jgi:hypothetical protein
VLKTSVNTNSGIVTGLAPATTIHYMLWQKMAGNRSEKVQLYKNTDNTSTPGTGTTCGTEDFKVCRQPTLLILTENGLTRILFGLQPMQEQINKIISTETITEPSV